MSHKKELVSLPADVPHKKVNISLKLNGKEKFLINEQLFIIGFEKSQTHQTEIILGDRISKVNGKQMKTRTEVLAAITTAGEVSLEIIRRRYSKPVPRDRFDKVIKSGDLGFSYFLVECVKEQSDKGQSFGFTMKVMKNRAYIMAIEPASIASRFFAIGDALCDLDSVPIPMNDTNFIKNYAPKFFKKGRFTAIVERAVHPESIKMASLFFRLLAPQEDVEMNADAIEIGRQASIMHRFVFRKLTPTSILSGDVAGKMDKTAERTASIEEGRRVKIDRRFLVTTIGSDVEEDDSLRKVKKKHKEEEDTYDNYDDY